MRMNSVWYCFTGHLRLNNFCDHQIFPFRFHCYLRSICARARMCAYIRVGERGRGRERQLRRKGNLSS